MEKKLKKTIVIGASPRPHRYSYSAVELLTRLGFPVVAIGLREDKIGETIIHIGLPELNDAHTICMYVGSQKQPQYYDYILNRLKPIRIIFNPGTENKELYEKAALQNIEVIESCTLMMLSQGIY